MRLQAAIEQLLEGYGPAFLAWGDKKYEPAEARKIMTTKAKAAQNIVIVYDGEQAVGFATSCSVSNSGRVESLTGIGISESWLYMSEIFLVRGYTGFGYGVQMTKELLRHAKKKFDTVVLRVDTKVEYVARFYTRLGFSSYSCQETSQITGQEYSNKLSTRRVFWKQI